MSAQQQDQQWNAGATEIQQLNLGGPDQMIEPTKWFEPCHEKTNKMACAPSEDSDQPGHPPSLIRLFAVRMKKHWVLSYTLSAHRRLWTDCADAQTDHSLRWAHTHFVGFVMSWLNCVHSGHRSACTSVQSLQRNSHQIARRLEHKSFCAMVQLTFWFPLYGLLLGPRLRQTLAISEYYRCVMIQQNVIQKLLHSVYMRMFFFFFFFFLFFFFWVLLSVEWKLFTPIKDKSSVHKTVFLAFPVINVPTSPYLIT